MKFKYSIILFLTIVFSFLLISNGNAVPYPNPQGYVNDFAGIIDGPNKEKIHQIASEVESKTSAQIAVVTLKSLEGENLEYYANELFTKWKIGQKGKDNGVLILLALKERKIWIETGYGLEPILPDGRCGQIIRESMVPYLKQGDYAGGLLMGTMAVAQIIAKDAGVSLSGGNIRSAPSRRYVRKKRSLISRIFSVIFFFIMILVFIRHPFLFLFLMAGSGRGGFGGGGFSGGSGGFGGFGGGLSGGGGAGGSW